MHSLGRKARVRLRSLGAPTPQQRVGFRAPLGILDFVPEHNTPRKPGATELTFASILRSAERLRRACADVTETFAHRADGPGRHAAWEQATRRLHQAESAMYPGAFRAMIERLAAGESDALEPALVFLEADPWCFRSGYAKERIAQLLARHRPDPPQRARIERVLLHVVDVGDRREFRRFCRLARSTAGEQLVDGLRQRLLGGDRDVARRALLMLSELSDEPLSAHDTARAREILLQAARRRELKDPSYAEIVFWFPPSWVAPLVRRYWATSWGHDLVAIVMAGGEGRQPATQILTKAPELELRDDEHAALTRLLLRAVDSGCDMPVKYLAWRLDTPELRGELEQRRHSLDEQVAKRAWSTLNDLLGESSNPRPEKWRTGDRRRISETPRSPPPPKA
jgi:hypothetical protein